MILPLAVENGEELLYHLFCPRGEFIERARERAPSEVLA